MNTAMILAITLVFLSMVGVMGFVVYRQIKKTDPKNIDPSLNPTITSAQDFIPFKNIEDDIIDLGGHNYRMIIECSSINYDLKTDKETDIIEASYQRLLNSLTFPITIYTQTRLLDNSKLVAGIKQDIEQALVTNPQLTEYAIIYLNEMANLNQRIQNNIQKKKYIIIPYQEASFIEGLSDEEKYKYSVSELQQRAFLIMDSLSSIGIKSQILNNKKLIELIYSTFHKDSFNEAEFIASGDLSSLIVDGKNKLGKLNKDKQIEMYLTETKNKISNVINSNDCPEYIKNEYIPVLNQIEQILAINFNGKGDYANYEN